MPERFCLLFTVVIGAGKIIFTVCIARYKNPKLLKRMQSMKRATRKAETEWEDRNWKNYVAVLSGWCIWGNFCHYSSYATAIKMASSFISLPPSLPPSIPPSFPSLQPPSCTSVFWCFFLRYGFYIGDTSRLFLAEESTTFSTRKFFWTAFTVKPG